ncbi:MAG: DUF2183 domain-containing protein [Bdellovibrio sp.]|nr:DUF2183 domain-containing protein [Bdellovibrio sp.]
MKVLLSFIVVIAVTLLSSLAFSQERKVLLVSDIDDTIKNSHVLSTVAKLAQGPNITAAFTGMSQLYTLLNSQKNIKIVYLSNAPQEVAGIPAIRFFHQSFLDYNKFPKGDLLLRADLKDMNHKITQLRLLMQTQKPTDVILVGDNGERDSEIYHQLTEEYKNQNIKFVTFIHQLYSSKRKIALDQILGTDLFSEVGKVISTEQFGYVTPVEIALQLHQEGLLSDTNKQWMIDRMAPYIASQPRTRFDASGETTFAAFEDCSDFQWRWPVFREINGLVEKIRTQCK